MKTRTTKIGRFTVILEESFSSVGLSSNVYITKLAGSHYLFDTSGHSNFVDFLKALNITPESLAAAFLTHGHYDHIQGLTSLSKFGIPVYISTEDLNLFLFGREREYVASLDEAQDILVTLGMDLLKTPGHTPGSVCYYSKKEKLLISGDTVFSGGYFGRIDLLGGNGQQMKESLRRLASLELDALLPGHGMPEAKGAHASIVAAKENAYCLLG